MDLKLAMSMEANLTTDLRFGERTPVAEFWSKIECLSKFKLVNENWSFPQIILWLKFQL